MFRLLRVKKQLEQKQVADYAMVPVRDARELLYRMLRGGFLTLQVRPSHVLQSLSGFEACTSSSCLFSCHGPKVGSTCLLYSKIAATNTAASF